MKVSATQTGSTFNGLLLRVFALTGAKAVAQQSGAAPSANGGSSTTFTLAGTVQQSTSRIYGAVNFGSGSGTDSPSNDALVDDHKDTTNGMTYLTFKQATPSTGSQTYGATSTASGAYGIAWLEVLAATTLAEDTSSPAVAQADNAITVQTADFTPPGGSLLVAIVSSDGGSAVTTMSVTDDLGTHLNWTEKCKANLSAQDYAGVWIADVTGGTPASANAGVAAAAGAVTNPAGQDATGLLYAGADAQISGTWAGLANAVGSGTGDYATWTDSGSGTSAVLELSTFGVQAAVPAGATVGDLTIRVRHSEDPAAQLASVTAQAYLGTSPYGSAQALTLSATVHEDDITVAGLTRTDLADLRVRVTATRN